MHISTELCLDATGLQAEQDILVTVCSDKKDQFWKFDDHDDLPVPR